MKVIQNNMVTTSEKNQDPQDGHAMVCLERPPVVEEQVRLERDNERLTRGNAQLAQERNLLRILIDGLPDSMFIKDRQSRILISNNAYARMLGATGADEVISKTDFDFFPPELAGQFFKDEQVLMESGQPLNREEMVVDPQTGQQHWWQTTKVPLRDKRGTVIGLMGISRELTDRKQAEEALARERSLLRTLIDNLPDCIYAKDADGRKILANPADCKNLRCQTEAEAIGKTDFDLFPKDIAEQFWADDQKVIQGQPVVNRAESFLSNGGEKRWLLTSKLPLRDASGKIVGLVGIGRDITENKQAEEALVRERLILQTLVDNIPDRIYMKDAQSRFVKCNPAVAKRLGVNDPELVIGKNDFDFYPPEKAREFYQDEQRTMQAGQALINKIEMLKSEDGQMTWASVTKVPLWDEQNKVVGLVGISRDITDQKQAEIKLASERDLLDSLLQTNPDLVYFKDLESRFVRVSKSTLERLYESAFNRHRATSQTNDAGELPAHLASQDAFGQYLIGKTDFDFLDEDRARSAYQDEQEIIRTGKPSIGKVKYSTNADGTIKWRITTKMPWRDKNGDIIGIYGVSRDVTQLKEVEEALRSSEAKLRQSTTQLERSNRELQDFAYVASHDLQEPLRKIVVFGDRLKEKGTDQLDVQSRDYLERMQKAAARMQILINDLLAFSRVTTRVRPFVQLDLAEVAREVVNDLEGRIELVKGRVEVGTLPLIEAEPVQMRQLLQNLIGNALKFRRPDAPPVVKLAAEIITGPTPGEGTGIARKLCVLTVSDNGIGFDEKYLDRIFNVFQRLHSRNEYEGTGMGLAITRKIVLFHRGEITAKSKPGEGTTFIVTLPVAHPKEPQTTGEKHE